MCPLDAHDIRKSKFFYQFPVIPLEHVAEMEGSWLGCDVAFLFHFLSGLLFSGVCGIFIPGTSFSVHFVGSHLSPLYPNYASLSVVCPHRIVYAMEASLYLWNQAFSEGSGMPLMHFWRRRSTLQYVSIVLTCFGEMSGKKDHDW